MRHHSVRAALHHNPYSNGYEEPIKNTEKILKSDMKNGSLEHYREFCSESLELVHSAFSKVFVTSHQTYSCLEWVIDYYIFKKISTTSLRKLWSDVGVWADKSDRLVLCEL
jgi:hypothetical protein